MTKDLEQKIRMFVEYRRGHYVNEPKNLEEAREIANDYKKNILASSFDNVYVFDYYKEGFYKFSNGEGWYFEGVEFCPKDEYEETEPIIPEYIYSLDRSRKVYFADTKKSCFGDKELKKILLDDRYTIITAGMFADALLEYEQIKKNDGNR